MKPTIEGVKAIIEQLNRERDPAKRDRLRSQASGMLDELEAEAVDPVAAKAVAKAFGPYMGDSVREAIEAQRRALLGGR